MAMERSFLTCTRSLSQSLRYSNLSKVAARSFSTALRPAVLPQTRTRQRRCLHSTPSNYEDRAPRSLRDPPSDDNTQADFAALDVLRNTVQPATSIDACTSEGFALNNNMRIAGCGVLLVGGEAYRWRPWLNPQGQKGTVEQDAARDDAMTGRLLNAKGQWEVPDEAWGLLDVVWPKPDLLIIGTGARITPIAPAMRKYLNSLGIRLDIQDTRNAAAQFNLLATERGVQQVAAALIPIGFREARKA
ncbi:uncharacterized protein CC84DRAFT_1167382 [Paraphaeosphaeria sporulosa]|uniref:NADH dehydrogenase [ubiquinone] 1 alpha subcomplex assembly factor 3 n=1 Tax=Paraphaeosphaeria sporulosa TaxID=1460663 RepID=A0A177C604_9PLEO|nr:uncharacterized protein CC84DRAFT_1167382 [Paraphaeosphaeria sporulosa]OAG02319.1 hypothetical protein CC84DRAFT_1167382 [Paraphaeosphaeria sporulosa]